MKKIIQTVSKARNVPTGFYVLFYTEICELFGRFGITALLVLYLTKYFHFSDVYAFAVFGSFISLLFVTPIVGGLLSDRYLGKIHSIVLGATIMGFGNLLLATQELKQVYLWPGSYCYR
ncbi:MAG: hypothetical protein JXR42_05680 [Gammaproteobacteria bacterium]|nr:hypothetical protein [Gammaproteobacteria bacterium]